MDERGTNMSYLRLGQDRPHFEGDSETYSYVSGEHIFFHDSLPVTEGTPGFSVPEQDFYEIMLAVLRRLDLGPATYDHLEAQLVALFIRDRVRLRQFETESGIRARVLQATDSDLDPSEINAAIADAYEAVGTIEYDWTLDEVDAHFEKVYDYLASELGGTPGNYRVEFDTVSEREPKHD
jgi:hypothetical protein